MLLIPDKQGTYSVIKNSGRCFTFNETSSAIFACQQLYLPTLMVVYQFTIPMPVYQSSTKTSIFDDFFFLRIFGDFSLS